MKTFHLGFDQAARVAHVAEAANKLPGSVQKLGTFNLPEDTEDDLGYEVRSNRTLYHEVRDKLYGQGVQNMQTIQILMA